MLNQLKLDCASIINDHIKEISIVYANASEGARPKMVEKIHFYSVLLTDILDAPDFGRLHELIMSIEEKEPYLHAAMWELFKPIYIGESNLEEQLEGAREFNRKSVDEWQAGQSPTFFQRRRDRSGDADSDGSSVLSDELGLLPPTETEKTLKELMDKIEIAGYTSPVFKTI